jgi:hypothetical protein
MGNLLRKLPPPGCAQRITFGNSLPWNCLWQFQGLVLSCRPASGGDGNGDKAVFNGGNDSVMRNQGK